MPECLKGPQSIKKGLGEKSVDLCHTGKVFFYVEGFSSSGLNQGQQQGSREKLPKDPEPRGTFQP